jgi:hypothetical protein
MIRFFRKHHRWLGVILLFFLVLFSISGIIMNHRKTVSGIGINRQYLPPNYSYKDWNFAAVRSTERFSNDSILIYGNIGIWLTDSAFTNFSEFNKGFPKGVDNHKMSKVVKINDETMAAGSLFGLHIYSTNTDRWDKIHLPNNEENVVDLMLRGDTLLVLTRSNLFSSVDYQNFIQINLPAPADYDNKVGLFKTFWVIHSGEIYGLIGKLIVDLIAIIIVFLSIGGFIMFVNKKSLKKKGVEKIKRQRIKRQYQWHLKWHNRVGYTTIILLIITTATGIFLRPPFLIPIAEAKVGKVPYTVLDTPNPWYDLLRRIIYIEDENRYIISTQDAFYYSDDNLKTMICFDKQPPASVMGITVLEEYGKNTLMIGSFEGLFSWNYETDEIYNLIDKEVWVRPSKRGHPVGTHKISGYSAHFGEHPLIFDYDEGAKSSFNKDIFPDMTTEIIKKNPMPIWNVAQEVHTGRIFQFFLGDFYILIVPLTGLFTLYLHISGFIIWYKRYRTKKKYHKLP